MNILLDKLDFNESWAYETFKNIIKPEHKICVIPFAFHENWFENEKQWENAYNPIDGTYYESTISSFYTYGIKDHHITFINYFRDNCESARLKIRDSDILLFTGGYPDKIVDRLKDFQLIDVVEQYKGIIMGWSAGAMIQCSKYYISPDEDYPEFTYKDGLNFINDFAVEVHYKDNDIQNKSIEKFVKETGKVVYTTEQQSAIIVDHHSVRLLGNARKYELK